MAHSPHEQLCSWKHDGVRQRGVQWPPSYMQQNQPGNVQSLKSSANDCSHWAAAASARGSLPKCQCCASSQHQSSLLAPVTLIYQHRRHASAPCCLHAHIGRRPRKCSSAKRHKTAWKGSRPGPLGTGPPDQAARTATASCHEQHARVLGEPAVRTPAVRRRQALRGSSARASAEKMDAVPSPSTRPLATTTMSCRWLAGCVRAHACSARQPSTRGSVHSAATYMPTATPMPDGTAHSAAATSAAARGGRAAGPGARSAAGASASRADARCSRKVATARKAAAAAPTTAYGSTCGGSWPPFTCARSHHKSLFKPVTVSMRNLHHAELTCPRPCAPCGRKFSKVMCSSSAAGCEHPHRGVRPIMLAALAERAMSGPKQR